MAGLIAFDAATRTGWAMVSPSGATRHGVLDLRGISPRGELFQQFRQGVAALLREARPQWVFIEAPFFRGNVARLTFGLAAIIEAEAAALGVPFVDVPPATVKKHITGKGNATKDQMIAAIRGKGFSPADDNAADAIGIAHYAWTVKFGRAA